MNGNRVFCQTYCVVLACIVSTCLPAQTVLFPGLEGEALQDALRSAYRPSTTLTLAQAKDTLYSRVDNVQDSVEGIYSGYTLYLPPGQDASIWLFMNGSGINLEHVYPQSKGADEGQPGHSNMHHLYPARVAVNEARASYPFADIPDPQTSTWFRNNQSMQSIPTSDIDSYSESVNGAFEPRESVKGNIARAVFYFYTMYKDDADAADPNFFPDMRETLCQWHIDDPIDAREIDRSARIASYQDGKDNPFVLDCSAAIRAWCPDFEGCQTSSAQSVNKMQADVSAYCEGGQIMVRITSGVLIYGTLEVIDIQGRLISSQIVSTGSPETKEIAVTRTLPPGIYTLLIRSMASLPGDGIPQRMILGMTRCVVQ